MLKIREWRLEVLAQFFSVASRLLLRPPVWSPGSATSLLINMSLGMILGTGVGVGIKMFSNSLRKLPLARRTLSRT